MVENLYSMLTSEPLRMPYLRMLKLLKVFSSSTFVFGRDLYALERFACKA